MSNLRDNEEYLLFADTHEVSSTEVSSTDLYKVFHTISGHIRDKCKRCNIEDEILIKGLIVYVCRIEAGCISEDPEHDDWKCAEYCTDIVDVDFFVLKNEDFICRRKECFKVIYKCDECLRFTDSDTVNDQMEKILRSELKMKAVKHSDSCNYSYFSGIISFCEYLKNHLRTTYSKD